MDNKKDIEQKLKGWNYIENNEDIEYLLDSFIGFHDSVLVSLSYISGSKHSNSSRGMFVINSLRQVSMIFDGYSKVIDGNKISVELVFEGTTLLNLRPAGDSECSCLQHATLTYDNGTIYFFDGEVDENPEDYEYTWIKANGLRWRILEKDKRS